MYAPSVLQFDFNVKIFTLNKHCFNIVFDYSYYVKLFLDRS